MFDKEYWRKREEEVMERQNKEMENVYKQLKNGEVTLTSKAKAMAGVWDIPKGTQEMASEINPTTLNEFYKVINKLELENKQLKEELNNKNCSDCKNYIKLEDDHICTGELPY